MAELFDFGRFPELESERLLLRELIPSDADAVLRIRGDYAVTRYNGGLPYSNRQQALSLIECIADDYAAKKSIRWGITLKPYPEVIGMIGYNYWIRADFRASIGYDLARAYWGRGLMPEAVRAILDFGFACMALNRVEADASAANHASIRVLQKVGFQTEGQQHEQYYEESGFHDLALFALLRRDYLRD